MRTFTCRGNSSTRTKAAQQPQLMYHVCPAVQYNCQLWGCFLEIPSYAVSQPVFLATLDPSLAHAGSFRRTGVVLIAFKQSSPITTESSPHLSTLTLYQLYPNNPVDSPA
jgi:hypothetical protein